MAIRGAFKFFVLYSYLLQAEHIIRYTQDKDSKIKIIINLLQSVKDNAKHKKICKRIQGTHHRYDVAVMTKIGLEFTYGSGRQRKRIVADARVRDDIWGYRRIEALR
jgi:hypothetical protein